MKKLAVTLVLLIAPTAVLAQDSVKVVKAKAENDLEREMESVNEKCGTKLTVAIDWATFDADQEGWKRRTVSSYCEPPLNALRRFCETKNARAYIQKNVETVTCHAAKDKRGWKAVMEKGHLHWHVSPDSVNNDDYARTQLLENL